MFSERGNDGFFNFHTISFLTIALMLTVFSVFYGNWYYHKITGLALNDDIDEVQAPISSGNNNPPAEVINEVSTATSSVTQVYVPYASSVTNIINSGQSVSEEDLNTYRAVLTDYYSNSRNNYIKSSSYASKYSSNILSQYQNTMAGGISSIENALNEINLQLTTTVNQRFSIQIRKAEWTISNQEEIEDSKKVLDTYQSSLLPLGESASTSSIPIVNRYPSENFNLVLDRPEKFSIVKGQSESSEVVLTNLGPGHITNCRVSTAGEGSEMIHFTQGNFVASLNSEQSGAVLFNIIVPITATVKTYIISFQVTCNEGATNGFSFVLDVLPTYEELFVDFYESEVEPRLNFNLFPDLGMPQQCYNDLNDCSLGEESCDGYITSCMYYNTFDNPCEEFYETCFPESILSGYSVEEYNSFLNTFYVPYSEHFTEQCVGDILGICNLNPLQCPFGISSCVANQMVNGVISSECIQFMNDCSNGYYPDYSEMRSDFFQNEVLGYYNLGQACTNMLSYSSSPSACIANSLPVYSCIVYQGHGNNLGGSCTAYRSQCVNAPGVIPGSLSNGGSSGGSSGGISTTSGTTTGVTTTSGGTTIEQSVLSCQGDALCEQFINLCLVPLYPIALSPDNGVNFGNTGYNAITLQECNIEPTEIYIRPNGLNEGNSGSETNSGQTVVIHFNNQNSEGSESSNNNYVAAVLRRDNEGLLEINFLSSPYYENLGEKIDNLVNSFLFKEGSKEGNYINGMSAQQAEQIVEDNIKVPWILWFILTFMITAFMVLGKFLMPYNERLIISGKNALSKHNYSKAIESYNKIAEAYPHNVNVRQEALDYLMLLKNKLGKDKMNLEFHDKNNLPKIKTNKAVFSDYSRVHKMISDALYDLKKSPKMAHSRMPIIAEEYKKLDSKNKERLAPLYESLVYKLKK